MTQEWLHFLFEKAQMEIDAITILINSVLAFVTVGAFFLNRRESRARIKNIDALTDKLELDENIQLFEQLKKERDDSEKTIKRISKDIVDLQTDLRISRESAGAALSREVFLTTELYKYKAAYENIISRQAQIEKSQAMTKEIMQQHEGKIEVIERKTGELPKG